MAFYKKRDEAVYDTDWHDPGFMEVDLADDERVIADLKSEAILYDQLSFLTKSLGVTALGTAGAYLSQQLTQAQGFPAARTALIVSTLVAAVAEGTTMAIDNKSKSIAKEITLLEDALQQRIKYFLWASDYGGDTSVPNPWGIPSCLFKTTCVDSQTCTTESIMGESRKSCSPSRQCFDEVLTCRNN